jgi:hypothetical protein
VQARAQDAAAAGELEAEEPDEPEPADVEVLAPESVVEPLLFEPSDEDVELAAASPAGTVLAPLRLSVR